MVQSCGNGTLAQVWINNLDVGLEGRRLARSNMAPPIGAWLRRRLLEGRQSVDLVFDSDDRHFDIGG